MRSYCNSYHVLYIEKPTRILRFLLLKYLIPTQFWKEKQNVKLFKTTVGLILAASLIFATGCSNSAKKTITMGTLDGTKYTNEFFGLELNVPDSWYIASEEEKAAILQAGQEAIAENNEDLAKKADLAKEKILNLLISFRHPLTHQGTNPNVIIMAENLGLLGTVAVKSGKDYLEITKTNMEQAGMGYTFSDTTTEKLGGKDFDVLVATIDAGTIIVNQKYYVAIIDGYALTFITSSFSDEEAADVKGFMDTVTFK